MKRQMHLDFLPIPSVAVLFVLLTGHLAVKVAATGSVVDLKDSVSGTGRKLMAVGDGYWNTSGNLIIDSNGNPVYFSGLNWGGFDAANCVVDGLWTGTGRSYKSYLNQMIANGFNLIRLAFAGTCVQPDVYPLSINYEINPDLEGLTSLEVMVKIVEAAGDVGIRIILDYHRITPTSNEGSPEAGLWYDEEYPVSYWLNTWKNVTTLFKGNPTVVGVDVFNEPHDSKVEGGHEGPFWSTNASDPYNWRAAVKQAADVIQSIEPGLLICVQGMWNNAWWGGNLQPMRDLPLELTVPNKLVYQIHDYGPVVSDQPWFNATDFPANLPAFWDSLWGFMHTSNSTPVWVGEFGTKHNTTYAANASTDPLEVRNYKELQWFGAFCDYVQNHSLVWTRFTWGPNSRDTGGILMEDWSTAHPDKLLAVAPLQYPSFSRVAITNVTANPPPALGVLAPVAVYALSPPPAIAQVTPSPPPSAASHVLSRGSVIGTAVSSLGLFLAAMLM